MTRSSHLPLRTALVAAPGAIRALSLSAGLLAASLEIPFVPSLAWAAKPAALSRAPAVQAVLDCQKITDDTQRLACFDKAAGAMGAADASGDLVSIDREQRRAARRQAFGLSLPTLSFLNRGEKPEEIDKLTATVAAASQDPYGKWTIRLEDGAVWRQIDDNRLNRPARPGSSVEISQRALRSYVMKVDGQFPIKVHRDN